MNDAAIYEYRRDPFWVSTDPKRLDLATIHNYLTHSYWSPGIPKNVVADALRHSFCFGLYEQDKQIGLARVITDYSSFAYLCDVFVLQAWRGQGLGVWLIECIAHCPALAAIRTFTLATRDAHGLYRKAGFEPFPNPENWMMMRRPPAWRRPELTIED